MKIGIVAPQFGQAATRENIVQTAKTAEQENIYSLWVAERLLWPINPQTPYVFLVYADPDNELRNLL